MPTPHSTATWLARVALHPRAVREAHRSVTPLELLFDLCFVVAVAQAGAHLVGALAEGQPGHGVVGYLFVFFAIWWAWMNFTWFASAYDSDDPLYRILTFVQITGALVLAAGVPAAFDRGDFTVPVVGYLIMRAALTLQWLRAAAGEQGAARTTALRFAAGLVLVQAGWVALVLLPHEWWALGFVPMAAADLAVPVVAEHAHRTPWHPHHIGERYGLFTLIVLGESVAAATLAVQNGLGRSSAADTILPIAAGGLLIVFAAFWIYFAVPIHDYLSSTQSGFVWGYGHYAIFGSAAAIGAGLEVAVEQGVGAAHLSARAAAAAVTIPTSIFLFTVWLLHARHSKRTTTQQLVLPIGAALVLSTTFADRWASLAAGCVVAAAVAVGVVLHRRTSD